MEYIAESKHIILIIILLGVFLFTSFYEDPPSQNEAKVKTPSNGFFRYKISLFLHFGKGDLHKMKEKGRGKVLGRVMWSRMVARKVGKNDDIFRYHHHLTYFSSHYLIILAK